jgi:hypothetical protein
MIWISLGHWDNQAWSATLSLSLSLSLWTPGSRCQQPLVQIIFWTPHLVEYCSFYGFSSFAAAAAADQQITTICSREHIAFQGWKLQQTRNYWQSQPVGSHSMSKPSTGNETVKTGISLLLLYLHSWFECGWPTMKPFLFVNPNPGGKWRRRPLVQNDWMIYL